VGAEFISENVRGECELVVWDINVPSVCSSLIAYIKGLKKPLILTFFN
jgi:hypothetical protein